MMRSLNVVHLIGNVGNDPEIRATSSGSRIAKLSLATNRTWSAKDGSGLKEKTEWHRLTCFGRLADIVEQWVKKGDRIYVQGRIEYSQTEKDGVKVSGSVFNQQTTRYWTDIVATDVLMLGNAEPRADDSGEVPF